MFFWAAVVGAVLFACVSVARAVDYLGHARWSCRSALVEDYLYGAIPDFYAVAFFVWAATKAI
jgi:hypothetical protein